MPISLPGDGYKSVIWCLVLVFVPSQIYTFNIVLLSQMKKKMYVKMLVKCNNQRRIKLKIMIATKFISFL